MCSFDCILLKGKERGQPFRLGGKIEIFEMSYTLKPFANVSFG